MTWALWVLGPIEKPTENLPDFCCFVFCHNKGMASSGDIKRYRLNLQDERDASALYKAMAQAEKKPELAEVYRRLGAVEDKHAALWAQKLKEAGVDPSTIGVSWGARVKGWLTLRFGPGVVLPLMAAQERADQGRYDHQPEANRTEFPSDERSHARVLNALAQSAAGAVDGGALARMEGRHRTIGGNALRAAVLGANDGLLSNFSLVMGVAGAQGSEHALLVTGMAGLLAGACSMAIGEWISVQSSRELNERQISVEAMELAEAPAEEEEELALIYQSKGLPEEQAKTLAKQLIGDRSKALETLTREELGIDPESLGGSAWEAAFTSFVLFAFGAAIPVLPFAILRGQTAFFSSVAASALGLFGIGAAITLVTGRSVIKTGFRQLAIGLTAAAITYGVGHVLGVQLAG